MALFRARCFPLLLLALPGAAGAVTHPDPEGLFALADEDTDGAVTRAELRRLRRALGVDLERKAAAAAWKGADTDGSGRMSPAELTEMLARNAAPSADVRAAFDAELAERVARLDDDGSGTVGARELGRIVAVAAFDLSRDELDRLIALFDRDGDAGLDAVELGAFLDTSEVRGTADPDDLARRPPHPVDLDGDGYVAPGELVLTTRALGRAITPDAYDALRDSADRDGDRSLSPAELLPRR